jgi:acyl carrier protein
LEPARRAEVKQQLREIIAEIAEVDPQEVTDDALFVEDLEIDSLMAMEILIAIEKRFGIEVAEEKLLEFRTLRQVMDVVDEYISSA